MRSARAAVPLALSHIQLISFIAALRSPSWTFLGVYLTNRRVASVCWLLGWHLRGLFSIVAARQKA